MVRCINKAEKYLELQRENKLQEDHKNDCLILLSYLILLILSVITIWIFKHKRLRFVHETGFSLVFGLILGVIFFKLPVDDAKISKELQYPPLSHRNCVYQLPPDDVILKINFDNPETLENKSLFYAYTYKHVVNVNATYSKDFARKVTFDAEIFFNLLLPPIIFCAGYNMKKKHFFENLGAIVCYAFLGTILSSFIIGGLCYGLSRTIPYISEIVGFGDCLLFGSFISATDPVTVLAIFNDLNIEVDLYALVFGESVLNDAVAIVLANSVEKYGMITNGDFNPIEILIAIKTFLIVFLGALSIGCLVGVSTAIVTKFTYLRDHPLLETSLFFLMSYCSFLIAEVASLSGIVASLFCGITQAHYTFNNLSDESQRWTKEIFELLSFLAENFVFVYIGVSTITFREQYWEPRFISIALFSIIIGRAANVYLLSFLLNFGRKNKISLNKQHMLMFAGVRGAMAFALAIRNTNSVVRRMFFSTTLIIVMVTVFVCGGLTMPMINFLKIRMGKDNNNGPDIVPEPVNDTTILPEQILDLNERHKKKALLIRMFAKLDCQFIKPLLTHSPPLLTESCPKCCYSLAKLLTTDEQVNRNNILQASKNNISMDIAGENLGYKSDNELMPYSGRTLSIAESNMQNVSNHFKRRMSDQDLILTDTDDNTTYMEGEESGLYIQEYSAIPNTNSL